MFGLILKTIIAEVKI